MSDIDIAQLVPQFFVMDPSTEDLLPNGDHLVDGMIVLIEDHMARSNLRRLENGNPITGEMDSYEGNRALECNRWCTVTNLELHPYRGDMGRLVSFIAVYEDGTKRKRTYNRDYAWFVKLDSIPS